VGRPRHPGKGAPPPPTTIDLCGKWTLLRPSTGQRVSAKRPAPYVYPELGAIDAKWSDRYFHITPGEEVELRVETSVAMSLDQFRAALTVRSLWDTFEHTLPVAPTLLLSRGN